MLSSIGWAMNKIILMYAPDFYLYHSPPYQASIHTLHKIFQPLNFFCTIRLLMTPDYIFMVNGNSGAVRSGTGRDAGTEVSAGAGCPVRAVIHRNLPIRPTLPWLHTGRAAQPISPHITITGSVSPLPHTTFYWLLNTQWMWMSLLVLVTLVAWMVVVNLNVKEGSTQGLRVEKSPVKAWI